MPDTTHKAQFSDDMEIVDIPAARYPVRCRLSDAEYRALLDLLMCSDPWPVGGGNGGEGEATDWTYDELTRFANREAQARGYDGWIVAYHEHKAGPVQLTPPLAEHEAPVRQITQAKDDVGRAYDRLVGSMERMLERHMEWCREVGVGDDEAIRLWRRAWGSVTRGLHGESGAGTPNAK